MRIAAFVFALTAPCLIMAAPAPVEAAKPAKATKKAAKAPVESPFAILTAAAIRGDTDAQHKLALAYRDGDGVKADALAALSWLSLAAAGGSVSAATDAAQLVFRLTPDDRDAQARWLYRAARLGNDDARARWVEMVLSGAVAGVADAQGGEWIAGAARDGDRRALMVLADSFERGLGVPADPDAAERWWREALILNGDAEAQYRLGRILLGRRAAWRNPSTEEWTRKDGERPARPLGAVWSGDKPAVTDEKTFLGRPGMVEGENLLRTAACRGHAEAQHLLGSLLIKGMELPMALAEGALWLEAAAAQGHAEAAMALAVMAEKGEGLFAADPVRAYVLYDLAAEDGEEKAASAREAVAKALAPKQAARARQLAQWFHDL